MLYDDLLLCICMKDSYPVRGIDKLAAWKLSKFLIARTLAINENKLACLLAKEMWDLLRKLTKLNQIVLIMFYLENSSFTLMAWYLHRANTIYSLLYFPSQSKVLVEEV